MNKLYLFLVLLAIVSCLKRDDEETDDSTEVVSTSTEYLQDYSVEDIRNLIERANEFDKICESDKLPIKEDTTIAEACDLIHQFVTSVNDLKGLKEKFQEYYPDIKKYIEENDEKSQNEEEEENTQETEVVPVVEETE